MAYLHPGVYVEEIPSGSKPIEGVATSTAAFVGYTYKGPVGEPVLISKWDDYDSEYGGVKDKGKDEFGDTMGLSVSVFFQNGGTTAYIVRITEDWQRDDISANHAEKAYAYADHPEDIGHKAFKFTAVNEGEWANGLVVKLEQGIRDERGQQLYDVLIGREHVDDNGNRKFIIDETFVNVSLDESDPQFIKNVIDGVSENITVDTVDDISALNMTSDQFLGSSTSGDLSSVSLDFTGLSVTRRRFRISLDGNAEKSVTLDNSNFADLDKLAEHIQEKVRALGADACYTAFTCTARENKLVLISGTRQSDSSVMVRSDSAIAEMLKLGIADGDYTGFSRSGDLAALTFPIALSDPTAFPDATSRSLRGTIDGVAFGPLDLGTTDLPNLAAVAAAIDAIDGLTCAVVDTSFLMLTSAASKATAGVIITSDFGIAALLSLGVAPVDRGGQELSGQQNHELGLTRGVSISGDLSALTFPIALTNGATFPDSASRSLSGSIDGTPFSPFDLGTTDLADLPAVAAAINGIVGLSCAVEDDRLVLTSDSRLGTSSVQINSDAGIAGLLLLGVQPTDHGGEEMTGQQYHDANYREQLTGQEYADRSQPRDTLDMGADGGRPGEADYEQVFTQFIKVRDINIICLPGKYWSTDSSGDPVLQKALAHAERMKSRMVIVDPPPKHELTDANSVIDMGLPSQTYCVVYYPWVYAANRFYHAERRPGLPKNLLVPPSGYAAGMWSKIDARRGVWKAPAGMGTGLLGLSGFEHIVEDQEQDYLNPLGINCFRSMPGAGKVIWGARTRATKADPEWRYVPVRRTAIMIEQSIYNGIQWAVFEPNDHRLWSALRANIGNFMNGLFRVGAFQGEKATDSYFVRCGKGDTMTQGDIDAGQVIVVVGFAPLKPAEFVIVRIQQKVDQQ